MSRIRKAKEDGRLVRGVRAKRTRKVKGVEEQGESNHVELFPNEPVYVSIRRSHTINLGNYESEKVEVGLSVPCIPEKIDEVANKVTLWVDQQVKLISNQVLKGDAEKGDIV